MGRSTRGKRKTGAEGKHAGQVRRQRSLKQETCSIEHCNGGQNNNIGADGGWDGGWDVTYSDGGRHPQQQHGRHNKSRHNNTQNNNKVNRTCDLVCDLEPRDIVHDCKPSPNRNTHQTKHRRDISDLAYCSSIACGKRCSDKRERKSEQPNSESFSSDFGWINHICGKTKSPPAYTSASACSSPARDIFICTGVDPCTHTRIADWET